MDILKSAHNEVPTHAWWAIMDSSFRFDFPDVFTIRTMTEADIQNLE